MLRKEHAEAAENEDEFLDTAGMITRHKPCFTADVMFCRRSGKGHR
jgi:hypothetical protein